MSIYLVIWISSISIIYIYVCVYAYVYTYPCNLMYLQDYIIHVIHFEFERLWSALRNLAIIAKGNHYLHAQCLVVLWTNANLSGTKKMKRRWIVISETILMFPMKQMFLMLLFVVSVLSYSIFTLVCIIDFITRSILWRYFNQLLGKKLHIDYILDSQHSTCGPFY